MTKLADEYSKSEMEWCEHPNDNGKWDVECTNCGRFFSEPLPLLYDENIDEYFHGCPYCETDAWLKDLNEEE